MSPCGRGTEIKKRSSVYWSTMVANIGKLDTPPWTCQPPARGQGCTRAHAFGGQRRPASHAEHVCIHFCGSCALECTNRIGSIRQHMNLCGDASHRACRQPGCGGAGCIPYPQSPSHVNGVHAISEHRKTQPDRISYCRRAYGRYVRLLPSRMNRHTKKKIYVDSRTPKAHRTTAVTDSPKQD